MRLKRYIGFKYLGHIDHNKEFRFYPKGNVGPLKGFKKENNMIKFLVYKKHSSVQRKYWRGGKTRGLETNYKRLFFNSLEESILLKLVRGHST